MLGNPLKLGSLAGTSQHLVMPASARERHMWMCGGTGVGKSKLFESCVRQDIFNWKDSKCGLLLLDPHGLVYENTLAWLARHNLKRPVIPIDLRRDDWIISYNLLRKRKETDPAVVVANFVRALSHVWGEGGTDKTPLFAKWASVILLTLYHNGYTIADVMYLLSRQDIRRAMSAQMTDPTARQAWAFAERRPKEFEQQITSTLNRFNRLLGPKVMKATFGQSDVSLDLQTAIENGQIILVNMSTQGGQIDEEDADTFATLLLTDLWGAAKARGKNEREKTKPFYVYIDECQNVVTPTVAKNLDQARGFGLHLTLAQQFPSQLLNAGPHGKAMYDSILANAGTKIIFRLEHTEDIKALALWLFMNSIDTDQVKLALESTKVIGYDEQERDVISVGLGTHKSKSRSRGGGAFYSDGETFGLGGSIEADPLTWEIENEEDVTLERWNDSVMSSSGGNVSWAEDESESESFQTSITRSTILVPKMGKEISSVQYRSIDEQLFKAMQQLFGQNDRHFAIRYPGGPKAPLFARTRDVKAPKIARKYVEKYRQRALEQLAFALPMPEAEKRLVGREQKLLAEVVRLHESDEPRTAKRKIK